MTVSVTPVTLRRSQCTTIMVPNLSVEGDRDHVVCRTPCRSLATPGEKGGRQTIVEITEVNQ